MRVLLDTHLLLWALATPARLSPAARDAITTGEVYVSAASIWEISIKTQLGKLDANPREVLAAIEPAGFSLLPISGEHAVRVAELPAVHRDRFDRMLAAQASVEPMILLTNDAALSEYGSFVSVV